MMRAATHAQPAPAAPASAALFLDDVLRGLSGWPKRIPCKYLYDARGSRLFERICEQEEYYLTGAELAILQRHAGEMADWLGPRCRLVELGSGSGRKTRLLLDRLASPAEYVPVDISSSALAESARKLAQEYPALSIKPLCADYTQDLRLPECPGAQRTVAFFPGSTIGNLEPDEAEAFLARLGRLCGDDGGVLVGVDLAKSPQRLHAAYNDAAGVTAQFNLNLLARINRELEGCFPLDRFAHYAFYNVPWRRVEMHLVSLDAPTVRVGQRTIAFACGESIHTESSHKWTLEGFAQLAWRAGLSVRRTWTDERTWFAVLYLGAPGR